MTTKIRLGFIALCMAVLSACGLPTGHTGETTGVPQTCHQQQLPGRGGSWLPLDGAHSYATKADCVNDRNRKD